PGRPFAQGSDCALPHRCTLPMAEHRNLRVEIDSSIATVTLDRPEVLNALDARTIDELEAAVDEILVADEVRGAIVTGAGERAFVAGADINDLARMTPMSG